MEQKQINLSALNNMLEELAQKNWATSTQVFTTEYCQSLAQECHKLAAAGQLSKASIGKGPSKTVHSEIRGDFIQWLDETHPFHQNLELLRQSLNQFFFLGLKYVEAHFALYPPGSGYAKHIDNHRQISSLTNGRTNHRKITFVLYLNDHWQKGHGGELSLYNPERDTERLAQVEPILGTLILFRSELFPHQVERSNTTRLSLTGWFRDDAL